MCERCEILEEENLQLKIQLGMVAKEATRNAIRSRFSMAPNEAHVCSLLYQHAGSSVSKRRLIISRPIAHDRVDGDEMDRHLVAIYVCRLRKKLGKDAIVNDWGRGYYMTREAAGKITEAINAA